MNSMRIAFITVEYPPNINGGAGEYAFQITRELARLGHNVVVFTPKANAIRSSCNCQRGLEICEVGIRQSMPFKSLQFWLRLPKAIKEAETKEKFDIVHINGISYGFIKRRLTLAPHIVTIHHLVVDAINSNKLSFVDRSFDIGKETSIIFPSIERRCIECADGIIAVSKFTKGRISEFYNVRPDKISVIYNGVCSDERDYTKVELEELRHKFGLDEKPIVLFVGRVDDPRKGLDILLKAFRSVLNEVNANLLIVGKGDQCSAREYASKLGISDKIIFTGYLDSEDLKKCYHICDIYVSPSRLEGFGLTIIEAIARGVPIVATNAGAISEIIENRTNCILVDVEDTDAIAQAILLLAKDKASSGNLMKGNQGLLNVKFNWEVAAKGVEDIYSKIYG